MIICLCPCGCIFEIDYLIIKYNIVTKSYGYYAPCCGSIDYVEVTYNSIERIK